MTKRELKNNVDSLRAAMRRMSAITQTFGKTDSCIEAFDLVDKIQREFTRYIDVLELLEQHPCFDKIRIFMGRIAHRAHEISTYHGTHTTTEWEIVQSIIWRAMVLLKKEKQEEWIKCPTCHGSGEYKNVIYCTQCGKEIKK